MSSGRDEVMEKWNNGQAEQDLVRISQNVDNFYTSQATTFEIGISSLNAIMLARLMRLNIELGNEENFKKLMESIVSGELKPESKYLQ